MLIAVDTGGTKTLIVAFSRDGQALEKRRFPTPHDQKDYIELVAETIKNLPGSESISGISVAVPGVVRNNIALVCKNLNWRQFDVLAELEKHFPGTPMWLENDANLGGVGVVNLLPSRPQKCLYITIGTGIGGGFIVNGQIDKGLAESEISDMMFDQNDQFVLWESMISGKVLSEKYNKLAEELSEEESREMAKQFSRGLLALLPVFRPDIVTVGGGVGAQYHKFAKCVDEFLEALPEQYICPVVIAPKPEEIVAYGCYFYAKDKLNS